MKVFSATLALAVASMAIGSNTHAEEALEGLSGPYLGQTPPGDTPQPFAPGVVVTDGWEYGMTFMPSLNEAYFIWNNPEIEKHETMQLTLREGVWYKASAGRRIGQPVISPDGQTMHLGRRYKTRTEDGWSDVKMLDGPIGEALVMRMSSTAEGNLYFDTFDRENTSFPIRVSKMVDGKRQDPEALGPAINSGTSMSHPFVAPDESYLIWDAKREGGYGDSDIYISYRQADGTWGAAINLGDKINTPDWEAAASVTPDGKYLFFNRNMGSSSYENVDIFWVDASFIEELRPD